MVLKQPGKNNIHFWVPNIFEFKGGIQVYLNDILFAIKELIGNTLPWNTHILVINKLDKSQVEPWLDQDHFSFAFTGGSPKLLRTAFFGFKLFAASLLQQPDLIVCGHLNFAVVAYLLHRLSGVPYWVIVYGVDAWNVNTPLKCKALQSAEKIISISGYTRTRLVTEQHLKPDDIPLLPVTFNVERFNIGPKPDYLLKRHGLRDNQQIILTVARLADDEQYKGYDKIVKSLSLIRQEIPDVHYVLVGKGSDRPRIEALINSLDLKDHVTLAGFVPDTEIQDYYNLCDVFAMPSKGEGFGIVYLEALACGKPVIGGNQDGAIDALCHGELGILVDPDDVDAIARTLISLLQGKSDHPLIYQPEILRKKVAEIYGFERFKSHLAEIFESFDSGHV